MAVPTYVPGQVLTANDCSLWFTPRAAVATSDQSITTQTALVNDNTLVVAVDANATYEVSMTIVCDGPSSNGFSLSFTGPAGNTFVAAVANGSVVSNSVLGMTNISAVVTIPTGGAGANEIASLEGTLITGANAGNLQFQFAQQGSSATATRRRAGSRLRIRRVA